MKRKKLILASGLLTLAALAYIVKRYKDEQKETKVTQIVEEIRAFFELFGEIGTVYIDQEASTKVETKGGVIMEDGRVYHFDYLAGEIFYQEDHV